MLNFGPVPKLRRFVKKRHRTDFLIPAFDRSDLVRTMPVRSITNEMDNGKALAPIKSKQPGVTNSLLYSGSRFVGHQKSKGNQYDVEVILQVINYCLDIIDICN